MNLIQALPVWILFLAVAIPITCVAWNSRKLARDLESSADYEPKTTAEGPLIDNGEGTLTQEITVSVLSSISGSHTQNFGPIAISANAREWAANTVLLGLLLVLIGLIGLLHFPTGSSFDPNTPTSNDLDTQSGG